ncbi:MAG: hypothetical protein V3U02_06865 [Calditrichia bacterium]
MDGIICKRYRIGVSLTKRDKRRNYRKDFLVGYYSAPDGLKVVLKRELELPIILPTRTIKSLFLFRSEVFDKKKILKDVVNIDLPKTIKIEEV